MNNSENKTTWKISVDNDEVRIYRKPYDSNLQNVKNSEPSNCKPEFVDDEDWEEESEEESEYFYESNGCDEAENDSEWEDFEEEDTTIAQDAIANAQAEAPASDMDKAYTALTSIHTTDAEEEMENVRDNAQTLVDSIDDTLSTNWKQIKVYNQKGVSQIARASSDDTVEDILNACGISYEGMTIIVDGDTYENDSSVLDLIPEHRSTITVSSKIKGNAVAVVRVKLVEQDGKSAIYTPEYGTTLGDFLLSKDIDTDEGYNITVNGDVAVDYDIVLQDKTSIVVSRQIKGGKR